MSEKGKHYHGHRERLRERLDESPDKLHDYEVLEILLGKVLLRQDTKPLAKELLSRFQSIRGVLDAKPAELRAVPGFGPSLESFWRLLRELMARYAESSVRKREILSSPDAVAAMARSRLAGHEREEIWIAYVDAQNRLLAWEQNSKGTVDNSAIFPRDILERALLLKASGFILVHNHPGGGIHPSGADLQVTEQLKHSSQTLGLRFLDHIIVTDAEQHSIMQDGFL
jgi:DNA repair protein RadC